MSDFATLSAEIRSLKRLIKPQIPNAAEWITAEVFAKRTGMTKDQIRYFRNKYPEMIKPKPKSTHYLFNWTAYSKVFLAL